jgi:hypothetical protein
MILETLCVLVIIALCGCVYVIRNLLKKLEIYEKWVEESDAWIQAYYNAVATILNNMKQIDTSGAFETDDEVGQIFKMLKSQVMVLEQFSKPGTTANERKAQ